MSKYSPIKQMLINPTLVLYLHGYTQPVYDWNSRKTTFYVAQPIHTLRKRRNNSIFANNFNINENIAIKYF